MLKTKKKCIRRKKATGVIEVRSFLTVMCYSEMAPPRWKAPFTFINQLNILCFEDMTQSQRWRHFFPHYWTKFC